MFWAQQSCLHSQSPFALSLFNAGLFLIQKKNILGRNNFAILPHIKIYAGLLAFGVY